MRVKDLFNSLTGKSAGVILPTPIVLTKKVGDEVLIHIDLDNLQEATFVGFNVVYPAVVAPILLPGTPANRCDFVDGSLWASMATEVIVNSIQDHDSLQKYVYVSKAVKMGIPTEQAGRVVTVKFKCVALGTGVVMLEYRQIGRAVNGVPTLYETDCEPVEFTLQAQIVPPEPPVVGRVICIINVE